MCVCAIVFDILLQKVTALLSFVFVDSVWEIKVNHSSETVFTNFTMVVDVRGRAVRLGHSEWCGHGT